MGLLAFALLAGCEVRGIWRQPRASTERMLIQPRYGPYRKSSFFADGRAMRTPPLHTVSVSARIDDPARNLGVEGGDYVKVVPIAMTRASLERGRSRFERFCAACHGVLGDGDTIVARNMRSLPPPSLHSERIRSSPPGRIYRVLREGFGMMPAYEAQLDVEDRWAVVAYLEALWVSRSVRLDELPASVRAEALGELRP